MTNSLNEIKNLPTDAQTGGAGQLTQQRMSNLGLLEPEFGSTAITSLGTLLGPLQQPPKIQPASSSLLTRNINTVFARTGDIAAQLLTTFLPQISSTLYSAYSSAQVTPPTPLENFYALRVKAAPFGSNAPKKAASVRGEIHNREGFETIYTEWPLAESPLADLPFIAIQISPYKTTR